MRLDQYISERYGFSRNKAQQFIKDGLISLSGAVITKSAYLLDGTEEVSIQEDPRIEWVSRSAGKLQGFFHELTASHIDYHLERKRTLDIGSSTGGFTQVLLENRVLHVDAVDVWSNQFHPKLRGHTKVHLYEETDIRIFRNDIPYEVIVCDVSFISLREIIPEIDRLSSPYTEIFLLFKPQFEVGKEQLRKTWVPKDEKIILRALADFRVFLERNGFRILHEAKASVIGEAGNQEYMFYVRKI